MTNSDIQRRITKEGSCSCVGTSIQKRFQRYQAIVRLCGQMESRLFYVVSLVDLCTSTKDQFNDATIRAASCFMKSRLHLPRKMQSRPMRNEQIDHFFVSEGRSLRQRSSAYGIDSVHFSTSGKERQNSF